MDSEFLAEPYHQAGRCGPDPLVRSATTNQESVWPIRFHSPSANAIRPAVPIATRHQTNNVKPWRDT